MPTDLDEAVRSLLAHIGDAAGVPRDYDEVSLATLGERPTRSWLLVGVGAVVVAGCLVTAIALRYPEESNKLAGTTTEVGITMQPTTAEPTTTLNSDSNPVARALVIGDSLDVQVAEALTEVGLLVDAELNRRATAEAVRNSIEPLLERAALPQVVVVHLGSIAPASVEDYNSIAELLTDRRLVVFVTVHVNASWSSENNAHIRGLPSRYPNIVVVDWAAEVEANNVPGGMAPDGLHLLTAEARQFYENLLMAAVNSAA